MRSGRRGPGRFAAAFFHRRTRIEWMVLLVAVLLVTAVVARFDWFERADLAILDFSIASQPRPVRGDIVLVTIDDASIGAVGRWPWRRSVLAALVDQLAAQQPRVIGLDVILSEPDIRYPADDAALAESIRRAGNVILPVVAEPGPAGPVMRPPLDGLRTGLGHINLMPDADGVARAVWLREGDADARPYWQFAAAMAAFGQASPASSDSFRHEAASRVDSAGWLSQDRLRIPYAGPPGSFTRVPVLDVLSGQLGPDYFRGKFVIVGTVATGLGDVFPTPVSRHGRGMSGIEVQANVLQALREGTGIVRVPELAGWFATLLPVLLAALAAWMLTPRDALIAVAVLVAALIGGSIMLVGSMQLWFAPSAAVFGCLLVYPLWSWRRQEAALRFLSEELVRLGREPGLLAAPARIDHSLDGRMQAVYDMTARLRDMRRFLSDGLESLPEATLICNLDGGILVANRRAVALVPPVLQGINDMPQPAGLGGLAGGYGTAPDDEGGYDDGYGGLDRPGLPDVIETLFPVPGPGLAYWDALCGALDADGPVMSSSDSHGVELATEDDRRYLLHGAPLHGEAGRPAGVIVSLVDITTVRRAERQREQTLHFLSHDMRSPQASILALIDMQSRDTRALPEPELLGRISEHAHRTLALADDFIRLAQAESQNLVFADVEMTALVLDATDEMWALARTRGIELELDLDAEGVVLRASPMLLVRAIANLVSNAIKFSPPGAPVQVRLHRLGPYLAIEVTDHGPGIALEDQARLFRPFSRVHAQGSDAPSGSGLGLVFVKTVAERHGGRVVLRSGVGEGATFSIWLPLRNRAG